MISEINFSPLTLAVVLAWIFCVTFHEFSHALVGYIGGDASVKQRGYLTLDPTRFIDPVMSLLLPALILLMGGLPLPGGSVPVDRSLLRSEKWEKLVSAAGPASNFLLFLLLAAPLHPALGIVGKDPMVQPVWVQFLATMAFFNLFSVFLNLIPIPPLDGFGIVEHQLDYHKRMVLRQYSMYFIGGLFLIFMLTDVLQIGIVIMMSFVMKPLGFDIGYFIDCVNVTMSGTIPADY